MAIIKTKPNYSSTELDEILSHVRKSPEVANKITGILFLILSQFIIRFTLK